MLPRGRPDRHQHPRPPPGARTAAWKHSGAGGGGCGGPVGPTLAQEDTAGVPQGTCAGGRPSPPLPPPPPPPWPVLRTFPCSWSTRGLGREGQRGEMKTDGQTPQVPLGPGERLLGGWPRGGCGCFFRPGRAANLSMEHDCQARRPSVRPSVSAIPAQLGASRTRSCAPGSWAQRGSCCDLPPPGARWPPRGERAPPLHPPLLRTASPTVCMDSVWVARLSSLPSGHQRPAVVRLAGPSGGTRVRPGTGSGWPPGGRRASQAESRSAASGTGVRTRT